VDDRSWEPPDGIDFPRRSVNPDNRFRRLSPGARADLLRVLTSRSNVRADVIRQFHERGDASMVEVLSDLEADDLLRLQVIHALQRLGAEDGS
jgi:hypothetical protein